MNLYVAPFGQRSWNGLSPDVTSEGRDGPLPSIPQALEQVRRLREQNLLCGHATIHVRGGRYSLLQPIVVGPERDDVTIQAYRDEVPIIDGSFRIRDFSVSEIHGRAVWVADLSRYRDVLAHPRSLTVNDEPRPRSRYPKTGWLVMEDVPDVAEPFELFDGSRRFVAAAGDFDPAWRHPGKIDVIVNHLWVEERMPVASYDSATRVVTSTHTSIFTLRNMSWMGNAPCARYYLENVFEAMSEPGEWYVDTAEARLYYLPKPGETPESCAVRVPHLTQLLRVHGDDRHQARNVHVSGIHFVNTDFAPAEGWGRWWDPQTEPSNWREKQSFRHFNDTINELFRHTPWPREVRLAAMPQIAHDLPGAISFQQARDCSLNGCHLRSLGFYGVDVRFGCSRLRFEGNRLEQLGAGGFKIDGSDSRAPEAERTHHIALADNRILRCGRVYSSAAGIAVLHSGRNRIEHNEVAEQPYTGISVGWQWNYDENIARENLILHNHIHHIGLGIMSDLGGIYTLGCQFGTVIKGNVIHDVQSSHYGGNGIYLDEGSSGIRVEGNVVLRVNGDSLSEHWGRQNVYLHNLFALGARPPLQFSREESHGLIAQPLRGALFLRNVVICRGTAAWTDSQAYLQTGLLEADLNLYWDADHGADLPIWRSKPWPGVEAKEEDLGLAELQQRGLELHSRIADPGFADLAALDWSAPPNSPIHALGIHLPDRSQAGPRPPEARRLEVHTTYRKTSATTFGEG
jgi:hypothetical protein